MSQQQRNILRPLIGTALLCVLASVFLFAKRRFAKSKPLTTKKHHEETAPEEALAYWNAEKMRTAKAMPLPEVDGHERGKQLPPPSHSS